MSDDFFSTDPTGLAEAAPTSEVRVSDGDRFELTISSVHKRLGTYDLRMLAYNGSIPGPTFCVDQGARVTVDVTNETDIESTVHWHGLRLENRYDGVPFETQPPIPIGGQYTHELTFPDPGMYWYHPHMREDYALELGLYGAIIVEPTDPAYWPPVDRHVAITLDDLLIEDGRIAPFRRSGPTYTAMGRFGNVMLINGEPKFHGQATVGDVVRFYVVNTANTRLFRFGVRGARMKLVGGDSGRFEHESFIDDVLLATSERAVVDVLFDTPGEVRLEHRTPKHIYDLGTIVVSNGSANRAMSQFDQLRTDPELTKLRAEISPDFERPPDKTLAFWAEMPLLHDTADGAISAETTQHVCPMHPHVVASWAATCPTCGMELVATESPETKTSFACRMHPDVVASWAATCPKCGMTLISAEAPAEHDAPHAHHGEDSIEWEDDMVALNRETNATNVIWQLIDRESDAKNEDIAWQFKVGDRVKIRLVNEMGSDHPMPHPFHVHGAGRFLVLARDSIVEPNLVWKDTVLLFAGQTVDILLFVSNPGRWMAHCHITEHNQAGMMFTFDVAS